MGDAKDNDKSKINPKDSRGAAALKTTKEKPSSQGINNTPGKASSKAAPRQKSEHLSGPRNKKLTKMSSGVSRSPSANSTAKVPPASAKSLGNGKPALPPISSNNNKRTDNTAETNVDNTTETNGTAENNNVKKEEQVVNGDLVTGLVELGSEAECRVFELMTQIMLRHGTHCDNCGPSLKNAARYAAECDDQNLVIPMSKLQLTKPAPDFTGTAVVDGEFKQISLSDYKGKYLVFFFYPADFTFVCPTEIIAFSDRAEEFRAIGCEVVGCSTDSHFSHLAWINTPRKQGGLGNMEIPLLADKTSDIAKDYGVYKEDDGIAFRGLFIIDDKGNLRQITINDLPVGRSVDETLRLVQAFQFTDKHGEVCPAGWKPGKSTMKPDVKGSKAYFEKAN